MRVIGLTGGIGSGKSTLGEFLRRELKFPVIDADAVAKMLARPGSPTVMAILKEFGEGVVRPDGTLDRQALGRVVFVDAAARARLEALTHPYILADINWRLDGLRMTSCKGTFVESATLIEVGWDSWVDDIILVTASEEVRLQRILARDPLLTEEDARARIASQMTDAERIAKAHVAPMVIDNSKDLSHLYGQAQDLLETLLA